MFKRLIHLCRRCFALTPEQSALLARIKFPCC